MCKLKQYILKNYPSDVEIILTDASVNLTFLSHKCILGCYSSYYHELFQSNKDTRTFYVEVKNARVAYDLLLSFIHEVKQTETQSTLYLLEMFRCRKLFRLDADIKSLYNLKMNKEEYTLFMEIVNEFNLIVDTKSINQKLSSETEELSKGVDDFDKK